MPKSMSTLSAPTGQPWLLLSECPHWTVTLYFSNLILAMLNGTESDEDKANLSADLCRLSYSSALS